MKHTLCNRAPAYVCDNIGATTSANGAFNHNCPKCRISRLHPFFTAINYRYLFVSESVQSYSQPSGSLRPRQPEELVQIGSRLKKEELSFYPSQFVFAESEGNYVVFHLNSDDKIRKVMIRNSITEIEQQLSPVAFIMRTHRAYIVNVKKVRSRNGNSLGYHLKLYGSDVEIPVSRQNTQAFNQLLKQFR